MYCWIQIVVTLAVAQIVVSLVENKTYENVDFVKSVETRKKFRKKSRSTSSSSGDIRSSESGDSLGLTVSSTSSSESRSNRYKPKSSEERRGWRKWHRKCPPCPEDMVKKWRDKSINWICGGYQRARRSFKSECMMHYRNCQDGTMFVKIHNFRCRNDTGKYPMHGLHFFYDYGKDSQDTKSLSRDESSSVDLSNELYK